MCSPFLNSPILVLACLIAMINAQTNDFITGSLTTARYLHIATQLHDGEVLVAGGYNGQDVTIYNAELYNPITGAWTVTGSLNTDRSTPTSSLLNNGNVLLAGGFSSSGYGQPTDSAELYNPSTGTWTKTGSLETARNSHSASTLLNGNVLVSGGDGNLASCEIYNIGTGIWSPTGSLNKGRSQHTSTTLNNGTVLVAGGQTASPTFTNTVELYTPSQGTWAYVASLISARLAHTATLLSNGNVLVAGGAGSAGLVSSAEFYNVSANSWTAAGNLITPRSGHTATLLFNGLVILTGGQNAASDFINNVETYNISSNSWTGAAPLMSARYGHTATLLPNGNVLLTGGDTTVGLLSSSELLIFTTPSFLPSCCSVSQGVYSVFNISSTLQVDCLNCYTLTTIGNFQNLALFNTLFVSINLNCTNCPALVSFGSFTSQTVLPSIFLACTNCPLLQDFGDFSLLSSTTSSVSLSCTNCSSLGWLGNFPLLSVDSPISLSCTLCPLVNNVSFSSLSIDKSTSISFDCNPCSTVEFVLNAPLSFTFGNLVPSVFSTIAPAASIVFMNAVLQPSLTLVGLLRIQSLSFVNVSGLTNLDILAELGRIDGSLVIEETTLINLDGIIASLALVGSVSVINNPLLCNVDISKFDAISTSPPIISNNGYAVNCQALEPATPPKPTFVSKSSSTIQLTWTLPVQPSILTTYSLTFNGVTSVTFSSWNPISLPYNLTSLSPSSTYTFVLTATLNGVSVISPSLIVTTDSGVSTCLPGYYKNSNGTCIACGVAEFPSADLSSCISCPPGTFSNETAVSSSSCELCPSGMYSTSAQSTECLPCPSSNYCPFGSAATLASSIPSSSVNASSVTIVGTANLSLGYVYLIVFFVACLLVAIIAIALPRPLRAFFLKFALLIRTPRFLFRVNLETLRIVELPSVVRGVIGIWIILAVILVTVYQINNFVANRFTSLSTIQPGSTFSSGQATLSAPISMNATILLFASPINCALSAIVTISDDTSSANIPVLCASNSNGTAFNFTTSIISLPSTTTNLQLTINANENLAYAPALQYSFTSLRYDGLNFSISETIVGGASNVLTGATTVSIAAVATETLNIDGWTLGTGYDFSYISTDAGASPSASSTLSITFQLSVPQYFLQVRQVESISVLTFISGLLAIGSGVVTFGTLIAFGISYGSHHWFRAGSGRKRGGPELVKMAKLDPPWL